MHLGKQKLTRLKPIKFPTEKGTDRAVPKKPGKSTKEVIAEMKRLSKENIFITKE